ncbi:MAG: cupredoxin domain-containing protein [Burkholderiales bacterium]|nr:cupredoxin domain-containing protein [Burkholderiales bacterium]MDE2160593.1 cupredoxin domain-containing protein [Burkholderiales bacterium]MDE2501898.1 cupredoxin domain-containing protein [Burkholderiales bacterium]
MSSTRMPVPRRSRARHPPGIIVMPADERKLNGKPPFILHSCARSIMSGAQGLVESTVSARPQEGLPPQDPDREDSSTMQGMKPGWFATMRRCVCCTLALQGLAAAPALGSDAEYTIAIKDHRFVPDLISIPAGQKVRLLIDNQSDSAQEFDSHALNREKHLAPRSQAIVYIGPLDPGRYIFQGEESDAPGGPALGIIEAR